MIEQPASTSQATAPPGAGRPRISIISKVGIPLSVVVVLLVTITTLTAFEFLHFRTSINELSTRTLPQITLNSRLSSLINKLLYQTERLAGADSQPERRLAWREIRDQFRHISNFAEDIDYRSPASSPTRHLALLETSLSSLNTLIEQKITLDTEVTKSINELIKVEQELLLIGTYIRSIVTEEEAPILEGWYSNAYYMSENALMMTTLKSLYQIQRLEGETLEMKTRLEQLHGQLSLPLQALTQQVGERLDAHIYSKNGLIHLTKERVLISSKTMGRSNFARHLVEEVGETGTSLFLQMNDSASNEAVALSRRIDRKTRTMAALTMFALFLTVVVFIYFRLALIGRLVHLNREILERVAGRDRQLNQQGNDEIADIARSVNYFTSELSSAKERAEAASEAKSNFLAHMSHEIRTPLNGITGFCSIALQNEVDPETKSYLTRIEDSSHSLLGIINDILDFSKIEAGELSVEAIDFDLRELLDKICNIIALKSWEKKLDFIIDVSTDTPRKLKGDPLRLNQILVNLLNNAVKFTNSGQILLQVRPVRRQLFDSTSIEFQVTDTGIGMTESQIRTLFIPFKQADSSITRRYGGTGLGMTITKLLIERMGGEIDVSSDLYRGTTVRVVLPYPVVEDAPSLELPDQLQNTQVLLIDDNNMRRKTTLDILRGLGLTNINTSNTPHLLQEYLEDSAPQPCDLIVTHWQLIEKNSDLLASMRDRVVTDSSPGLILATNPATSVIDESGIEKVIDIEKPLTDNKLHKAIVQLLGKELQEYGSNPQQLRDNHYSDVLNQRHILLVEDNFINQQVAQKVMENQGLKVTVANNGLEALQILGNDNALDIDLILMDIQMPELDGFSTTRRIRQLPKAVANLPIVAMTAQAMKDDYQKCLAIGMDGYVSKPIDFDDFFYTLSYFLQLSSDSTISAAQQISAPA